MPIGTTAAIIGAGLLGAGASVAASNKNSKAINQSTDANLQANREAIAAQERTAEKQIAAQQEALQQGLAYQANALNANNALQAGAYNSSGQMQANLYNQRQDILQPWTAGGFSAFNSLNAMLGLPEQQLYTPSDVKFTPVSAPTVQTVPVATPAPAATPAAPPAAGPTTLVQLVQSPEYKAMTTGQKLDARRALTNMPKR